MKLIQGNLALQQTTWTELFQPVQPGFTPVVVDIEEYDRVIKEIESRLVYAASKKCPITIGYVHKKKGHQRHPFFRFIVDGLPFITTGYTAILNIEDYATKLNALQRWEAIIKLFDDRINSGIKDWNQITEAKIQEKRQEIQYLKTVYAQKGA